MSLKHEYFFSKWRRCCTFIVPHKHNKNAEDFLFYRLSLYSFIKNKAGGFAVLCLCLCGNFHSPGVLYTSAFHSLPNKSYHMQKTNTTLHVAYQRLTNIYYGMRDRCLNPGNRNFHRYGGRGIVICPEWLYSKDAFIKWSLDNGYNALLTIDRINNDGNYEPSNCRWITPKENVRNNSRTLKVIYGDEEKPLVEWCEILGFDYEVVRKKVLQGIPMEQALTEDFTISDEQQVQLEAMQARENKLAALRKELDQHLFFFDANSIETKWDKFKNKGRT